MKRNAPLWLGLLALSLPMVVQAYDGSPAPISTTEGSSRVVALVAGDVHNCALRADGRAVCWGEGTSGQLDVPASTRFLALAAGGWFTCGLKADATIACWGELPQGVPVASSVAKVKSLSASDMGVIGVKPDGTFAIWGNPYFPNPGPYALASVASGSFHGCGIRHDGSAMCWPSGGVVASQTPAASQKFLALASGWQYTCGLKQDGKPLCWGASFSPVVGQEPTEQSFVALAGGFSHACGLKADGSAVCWGSGQVDSDDYVDEGQSMVPPDGRFIALAAGYLHTCGVETNGSVQCWGAGGPGGSQDADYGQSTVPEALQSAGAVGFGQIAAGNAHACGVRTDGSLGCWGSDDQGQATPPAGLFNQVAVGDRHSCALGEEGNVHCWGADAAANTAAFDGSTWRQLALGKNGEVCAVAEDATTTRCLADTTDRTEATGFRAISQYKSVLCRVKGDSKGYCDGEFLPSVSSTYWHAIDGGLLHACGLRLYSDVGNTAFGTPICWGDNAQGQIEGIYTGTARAISTGYNHACAIVESGQLVCWGSNVHGQATPPIGTDTYVQVAAGNTFTCAIRSDGVRVCWGDDNQGQAPQLALLPHSIADGLVGTAHAGVSFTLVDAGTNADGDYVPPTPVFYADPADLPPGLSLSPDGILGGTPTAGGTYTFTVEGEDANGFVASNEFTVTIIADTTPPEISYTLNGESGPFTDPSAWFNTDVAIAWTVTDPESTITGQTGCAPSSITSDTDGATATCTAESAGGEDDLTTVSIRRDATAPTIEAALDAGTLGNNDWYISPVTVRFTCDDTLSGIAEGACPADQVLSTDGNPVSSSVQTVQDIAGNTSAASNVVTVKIDQTAPVLAPSVPDPILRGQSYSASPNATDATSGIASSSCGPVDTTSLGDKSLTCDATDNAGNTASANLSYTVTTTCSNDGYSGTQLTWCRNVCEKGYTGAVLNTWIHRWVGRYRDLPYCMVEEE